MLNCLESLAMSTSLLKALPGKLDIKRHSPGILYNSDLYFQFNLHHQVWVTKEEEKGILAAFVRNNSRRPQYLLNTREYIRESDLMYAAHVARISKEPTIYAHMREYILERNPIGVIHVEGVFWTVEACVSTYLLIKRNKLTNYWQIDYSKTCPKQPLKNRQNKGLVLKTNRSLMKVKNIAECSLGTFCNTFDLH